MGPWLRRLIWCLQTGPDWATPNMWINVLKATLRGNAVAVLGTDEPNITTKHNFQQHPLLLTHSLPVSCNRISEKYAAQETLCLRSIGSNCGTQIEQLCFQACQVIVITNSFFLRTCENIVLDILLLCKLLNSWYTRQCTKVYKKVYNKSVQ